ncbi:hypothetical protein FDP41_013039 [Naegleria fowleri]|uniref:Uncharacterized protein n=1 Tax=Naegleria fowleri TaxID=5763 RepID=A0A6A5C2I4_NAEFO|nr:uncharacterized protein FDP41_013039 [Naegleria fowleri]KAF0981251.1 hypothetical protein FDP41_013039 [Naegleria fowleri]
MQQVQTQSLMNTNKLIIFRGISGSGKTHICDELMKKFVSNPLPSSDEEDQDEENRQHHENQKTPFSKDDSEKNNEDSSQPPLRNVIKLSRDDLRESLFPKFIGGPTFSEQEERIVDEWIKRSVRYFFYQHSRKNYVLSNEDPVLYVFVDGMCLNGIESVKCFEKLCKGIFSKDEKGQINGNDLKTSHVMEMVEMVTTMNLPSPPMSSDDENEQNEKGEKLFDVINLIKDSAQPQMTKNSTRGDTSNLGSKPQNNGLPPHQLASFYCIEVERDESKCKDAISNQSQVHPAGYSRDYEKTKQRFKRMDEEYASTINYRHIFNDEENMERIVNDLVEWINSTN